MCSPSKLNLVRGTCVLHPKIPNVPTCGRDTVKREVREEQEKNKDTLLYGPMDKMRRKQMLIQRLEGQRDQISICYLCYN